MTHKDLYSQDLHEVPQEICKEFELERLDLWGNHLKELPECIGNLKKLKVLWLHDNELNRLPKSIVNLTELISIDLQKNKHLILFQNQKNWLKHLKENGCSILVDDDLMERKMQKELI